MQADTVGAESSGEAVTLAVRHGMPTVEWDGRAYLCTAPL